MNYTYFKQGAIVAFCSLLAFTSIKAEEINLTINGMVCAFCAQGLADLARSFDPVEQAYVDMDNSLVVLVIRAGYSMPDAMVHEYVRDAGYDLQGFFRVDQSTDNNIAKLERLLGRSLPSRPSSAYLFQQETADGGHVTYARLTLYRNHVRSWNRAMSQGNEATTFAPSDAPSWWFSDQDPQSLRIFKIGQSQVALSRTGTLAFLKIQHQ
ncbi:MAG: hypothetical protein LR015_04125 [Verrucomicrobia bacterium]|nr:hypothetical protein [Verrucomicrobiota bacterium]